MKNIFITFGAAIFTILVIFGGYGIFAQEVEYIGQFYFTQSDYHADMNGYFNEKLEHLVELMEVDDFYNHEDFKAPSDEEGCDETNISTYCVAIGALDMYIEYLDTLNGLRGFLPELTGEIPTQEEAVRGSDVRDEKIKQETEDARLVMEATVAAYDAFKMAYPMHVKYETIINNLMKYKLALKRIRNRVERFPIKFIDATSSECK